MDEFFSVIEVFNQEKGHRYIPDFRFQTVETGKRQTKYGRWLKQVGLQNFSCPPNSTPSLRPRIKQGLTKNFSLCQWSSISRNTNSAKIAFLQIAFDGSESVHNDLDTVKWYMPNILHIVIWHYPFEVIFKHQHCRVSTVSRTHTTEYYTIGT